MVSSLSSSPMPPFCWNFLLLSIFISLAMDVGREKKNLLVKSRSAFPGISWGNVTLAAALWPWLVEDAGFGGQS